MTIGYVHSVVDVSSPNVRAVWYVVTAISQDGQVSLLAQTIVDRLLREGHATVQGVGDRDKLESLVDQVLKARDKVLKNEEEYGPGFNRDGVGFKRVDGEVSTYTRLNRR